MAGAQTPRPARTASTSGERLISDSGWERESRDWIAWARTPGHDAYWYYRDAFFELVPPPGRATLEVGCGEGA